MVDKEERAQSERITASVLLQIGTTVAAVAVALATLAQDTGPTIGDLKVVAGLFLVVGLVSIYGSLSAMAAIWVAADMRFAEDILGSNAEAHQDDIGGDAYRSLIVITWALWFLTAVYIVQLFATAF